MKPITFLIFTMIIPILVSAHCPVELNIHGEIYCTDIQWNFSEQKKQNEFVGTTEMSPTLTPTGTIPPLWLYSKAHFVIWKDGDHGHTPQTIPGFRIFPYMQMDNGHHHSTSYVFEQDPATSIYVLKNIAFVEMPGCWSLRWTTNPVDSLDNSYLMSQVFDCDNTATLHTDDHHEHH